MPSSRLSCLLVAAGLAGVALAAPAMADPANTVSAEIQYDNNALNTHSGAVSVLESVENQALDVCRYDAPISTAPVRMRPASVRSSPRLSPRSTIRN